MDDAGLGTRFKAWARLMVTAGRKDEPSGQMTWAIHVTIAPTWFDPSETPRIIVPFMFLYARHDAFVKAVPDNPWLLAWPLHKARALMDRGTPSSRGKA
jgi:hypothetical protein